jgi:hypothetical protein
MYPYERTECPEFAKHIQLSLQLLRNTIHILIVLQPVFPLGTGVQRFSSAPCHSASKSSFVITFLSSSLEFTDTLAVLRCLVAFRIRVANYSKREATMNTPTDTELICRNDSLFPKYSTPKSPGVQDSLAALG